MVMLSFKQVESKVRKSTVNNVVVGLLSFLVVWILNIINIIFFQFELKMAVHTALMQKRIWSEQLLILFKKS